MRGKRRSFKQRLIIAFLLTSGIPMLLMTIAFYSNNVGIVRRNMDELANLSLQKTRSNIDAWLSSYEELLYQICTSDEIVTWTDELNQNTYREVAKKKIKAKLQELFYSRSFIKSVTLLPQSGGMVFYDQYTTVASKNSWIDNMGYTESELYAQITMDGDVHLYSTSYATDFNGTSQYLFHIGRRLVDYKALRKKSGAVILSVDVALLQSLCDNAGETGGSLEFILDNNGRLLSFSDVTQIGKQIVLPKQSTDERKAACLTYVNKWSAGRVYSTAYSIRDEQFGWEIISVTDQNAVIVQLQKQQYVFFVLVMMACAITILFALLESKQLSRTMNVVSSAFVRLGDGDLSTRVEIDQRVPIEMDSILLQFNTTLDRLEHSVDRERTAENKRRFAEIAALEAQINPHFLYNTLDTINWMAIQHDEREISDAISALGQILRYGIVDNDRTVPIEDEICWLNKYVLLQQIRLKGGFKCEITLDISAKGLRIHKLLLQPFIENAIMHGFSNIQRDGLLSVKIQADRETLSITISDNGRGIADSVLECINSGSLAEMEAKHHLGMKNAISRLHIYYGNQSTVMVERKMGTVVHISIPRKELEKCP